MVVVLALSMDRFVTRFDILSEARRSYALILLSVVALHGGYNLC